MSEHFDYECIDCQDNMEGFLADGTQLCFDCLVIRHDKFRDTKTDIKAFADHVRDVSSEFSSIHGKRLIVVDEAKLKAFLQATE